MIKRYTPERTRTRQPNVLAGEMEQKQRRINRKIQERDPTKVLHALKSSLEGMVEEHRKSAGTPKRPAIILVDWSIAPSIREHPQVTGIIKFGAPRHFSGLIQHVIDNNRRLNDVLVEEGWGDYRAKVLHGANRIAVGILGKKNAV